jgi:hypothetical protein
VRREKKGATGRARAVLPSGSAREVTPDRLAKERPYVGRLACLAASPSRPRTIGGLCASVSGTRPTAPWKPFEARRPEYWHPGRRVYLPAVDVVFPPFHRSSRNGAILAWAQADVPSERFPKRLVGCWWSGASAGSGLWEWELRDHPGDGRGGRILAPLATGWSNNMTDAFGRASGEVAACSVLRAGPTEYMTGLTEAVKSRTPLVLMPKRQPARLQLQMDQQPWFGRAGSRACAEPAQRCRRRVSPCSRAGRRPVVLMLPLESGAEISPGLRRPSNPQPTARAKPTGGRRRPAGRGTAAYGHRRGAGSGARKQSRSWPTRLAAPCYIGGGRQLFRRQSGHRHHRRLRDPAGRLG